MIFLPFDSWYLDIWWDIMIVLHSNINRISWKKLLEIVRYSFFFVFNFNWYHTTRNKWAFLFVHRMLRTVVWLHCLWLNMNGKTKQEFVLLATNNDYSSKTNSKQKLYLNFCLCRPFKGWHEQNIQREWNNQFCNGLGCVPVLPLSNRTWWLLFVMCPFFSLHFSNIFASSMASVLNSALINIGHECNTWRWMHNRHWCLSIRLCGTLFFDLSNQFSITNVQKCSQ